MKFTFFKNNITVFLYLLISISIYFIFYTFGLTSPSGIPNPLTYPFANNDFNFYREFATNFPDSFKSDYKPGPVFILIIYLFENILGLPDLLSPLFIIISLIYIIRLKSIFRKNEFLYSNNLVYYVLCPYLYYFTIFPSADILLAIIFAECFNLIINHNFNLKITTLKFTLICLFAVLIRPNGISVCLIFLFYFIYYLYITKKHIYIMNIIIVFLILLGSFYYYNSYKKVYEESSSQFQSERKELFSKKLNNLNYSSIIPVYEKFDSTIFDKFFASFGIRISYETTAPGYDKNKLFSFLRFALGIPLFISFLVTLHHAFKKNRTAILITISYLAFSISAIVGVSFERYFIPIFPFLIQFLINYLYRKFS
jgi:hypothetical protein